MMVATSVLRWTARVWSVATILVVAAFATSGGNAPTWAEWVGLLFFPIGMIAGMIVAWWQEGLGGAITVGSIAALYGWFFVRSGRVPLTPYFLLLAAPGFLFLACWLLERRSVGSHAV